MELEPLEERCLLSQTGLVPAPEMTSRFHGALSNADEIRVDASPLLATTQAGPWRSAVFNNGMSGTLDFGFTRDAATVNHEGAPIDIDEPRYGPPRAIIPTNPWSIAIPEMESAIIFGSGWDHDGTTPLAVVVNRTRQFMIFYRSEAMAEQNKLRYDRAGHLDLMNGAVPGFRYIPRGSVVHEGLVVILSQRDRLDGDTWIPEGITFLTTQDYGKTLTRVPQAEGGFDVPPIAGHVSDNIKRGQRWALSNGFPEKSTDDLFGVWFPWADYLHKSGKPKGGQVGVFRARRTALGQPWIVEPNKLVYERWQTADDGGHHVHSAGMFADGMASFWGDGGSRNMMARHICSNLENYTECEWAHIEDFHGAWSPANTKVYTYGNQAVSTAPGSAFGEILTAGDEQNEVVMRIQQPIDVDAKAIISSLKGSAIGRGGGSYEPRVSLWIHRLRGRGYVTNERHGRLEGLDTIHYSSDGILWASMANRMEGFPFLYGDKVIQAGSGTIYMADRPVEATAIEPLVLNPGGTNLSNDSWGEQSPPDPGCSLRSVMRVDNLYTYTDDGSELDPQPNGIPPVMDQMPIWEVTTDGTTRNCGARVLSGIDSDRSLHHWLTMWHYSMDGNGIQPRFRFGHAGTGMHSDDKATHWMANNQWLPTYNHGESSSKPNVTETWLWVFDGLKEAPRRWLMVGENFVQGDSSSYPLQPGATGSDELAVIDGFQTSENWTIALTFGLPKISAFSSQLDPVGPGTIRPIATFGQSQNDRIEVYFTKMAEPERQTGGTIWIDAYSSDWKTQNLSFPNVYIDKQDKVSLVVASGDNEFGATLQVMRNAYSVTSKSQAGLGSIRPKEIVLGSNQDQSVVTPLEWYAVQVAESVALGTQARESFVASDRMFKVLEVIPGDVDDDADVDFEDFAILSANFTGTITSPETGGKIREQGDFDGDGDVDFTDFSILSGNFTGTMTIAAPTRSGGTTRGQGDFDRSIISQGSTSTADFNSAPVVKSDGDRPESVSAQSSATRSDPPTMYESDLRPLSLLGLATPLTACLKRHTPARAEAAVTSGLRSSLGSAEPWRPSTNTSVKGLSDDSDDGLDWLYFTI